MINILLGFICGAVLIVGFVAIIIWKSRTTPEKLPPYIQKSRSRCYKLQYSYASLRYGYHNDVVEYFDQNGGAIARVVELQKRSIQDQVYSNFQITPATKEQYSFVEKINDK